MNTSDVTVLARHLLETQGARAIAEAAQKADAYADDGNEEQASIWRRVEIALREMRGPLQS